MNLLRSRAFWVTVAVSVLVAEFWPKVRAKIMPSA